MLRQNVLETLAHRKQYKYPFFLLGLYLTFILSTVCLANRLTLVGNLLLPGGIFVFVFTFAICDIVGEVYGYAYPRLFIWIGVFAEFIFALVVTAVSHTAAPEYFKYSQAYQIVFDPTIRYVVAGLVALLIGEFTNVYLLAKWKIFFRGRFFIARSLTSTAFGQALLTIIVDILNYSDKVSSSDLVWMMISGYAWKMVFAVLLVFPAWVLVKHLKRAEGIDYFDINTNFNPFILSLESNEYTKSDSEERRKNISINESVISR